MRKSRVSIPKDQWMRAADAYRQGTATTVLATQFGVTAPTVSAILDRLGIPRRSRSATNRMRAPVDEPRLRAELVAAQHSQREIAERLGVSQSTIERAIRRLGLKSERGRGSPLDRNYFWKGGRRRESEGYVLVKCPAHPHASKDGYVREHRLVMEHEIGRYLRPEEEVHHEDGNPRNNDPHNLRLFANHADHMRYEWAQRWREQYHRQRQDGRRPEGGPDGSSPAASENDVAALP